MQKKVAVAKLHFYADDTVICATSSLASAIHDLQGAFNIVQQNLCRLRFFFLLNVNKTKIMFLRSKRVTKHGNQILTLNSEMIKRVSTYKYLGFSLYLRRKSVFSSYQETNKKIEGKIRIILSKQMLFFFCWKELIQANLFVSNCLRGMFFICTQPRHH
ncbi:hypothetical protein GJAV_G00062940 [Gymnothorax javanicus]|nr:hypothetical protein GJAV_G00062940 [Gymnothorax javanicus]